MSPKPHARGTAGFTMVEFLIATLLGSILVVSTGMILTHSFRELQSTKENLSSQRDLSFACEMLRREIQPAATSNITVSASQITISKPSFDTVFFQKGNYLVFDPDSSTANDEVLLISRHLQLFSPTFITNLGVRSTITLLVEGTTNTYTTLTGFRNE